MGGGNGQKSRMAREKNMEKMKASKGSQLDSNKKAMTIQLQNNLKVMLGSNKNDVEATRMALNLQMRGSQTYAFLVWSYNFFSNICSARFACKLLSALRRR